MPKRDTGYDVLAIFERMYQGKMGGFLCQGFNPLAAIPNKKKTAAAFSKLKFLVVMDPLYTETAEFWKNVGEFNDVDSAKIATEVFRLPATCFAEETGSFTNSGRVMQWHQRAVEPPYEAKTDAEIMSTLFVRMRDLYKKEGGAYPDPIVAMAWPYANATNPAPEEVAREFNGKALGDVLAPPDPKNPKEPPKVLVKAGEQLPGFAMLRDDGSTACGNWLYSGAWTQAGNNMARRDLSDPSGLGVYPNWGVSWPANRRIMYNRAGASPAGQPWDPKRKGIAWDGTKWAGNDVPDMRPDAAPDEHVGPFIMTNEGVARLFAVGLMAEGPFTEHYEPFETPVGVNLMCPNNPKAVSNPAARVFKGDMEQFGKASEFPYAATTYRLTEHHHFWTKNALFNAVVQPSQFVEIGEE